MTLHELRYALLALLAALCLGMALGVPVGRATAHRDGLALQSAVYPTAPPARPSRNI